MVVKGRRRREKNIEKNKKREFGDEKKEGKGRWRIRDDEMEGVGEFRKREGRWEGVQDPAPLGRGREGGALTNQPGSR